MLPGPTKTYFLISRGDTVGPKAGTGTGPGRISVGGGGGGGEAREPQEVPAAGTHWMWQKHQNK